jgi:tRNA-specific 2-thiouridylase
VRVLAALSGGVDSSVAAALLADAGHEVTAVTLRLWGGEGDSGCCAVSDVEDARRSAAQLGLDHHVFDFGDEFHRDVVVPYVAEHAAGRTPNPCIECNRHLKFAALAERAEVLGFDAVATGHHARVVQVPGVGPRIARGADAAKDQSYVLYPVRGEELARVLFPIGHLTKPEVRRIAAARGLRTATKPDSQDVCFVTRADGRSSFLRERVELHPGRVVDESGATVGTTEAVELVTVGQRRGLDLAGGAGRRFVLDVDVGSATITVGPPERLRTAEQELVSMVWAGDPVSGRVTAQCSAHGRALPATVRPDGAGASVVWDEPERRVAPGQSVVLYDGDVVVGGGLAA